MVARKRGHVHNGASCFVLLCFFLVIGHVTIPLATFAEWACGGDLGERYEGFFVEFALAALLSVGTIAFIILTEWLAGKVGLSFEDFCKQLEQRQFARALVPRAFFLVLAITLGLLFISELPAASLPPAEFIVPLMTGFSQALVVLMICGAGAWVALEQTFKARRARA